MTKKAFLITLPVASALVSAGCATAIALSACLPLSAWAQASEAPAAAAAVAASTPKEIRKANRAQARKVYGALAKHKEIDAGNISVTAKGGAVTLNGSVTQASQIDMVTEIAKTVPGVTSVTNRLAVEKPLGQ